MEESADRWLIDGDCSLCRRSKHCSKACRKAKERQTAMFYRNACGVALAMMSKIVAKSNEEVNSNEESETTQTGG